MERRIFDRFNCQKDLAIKDLTNNRQYNAVCRDVSGGGVGVEVNFPLRLMHILELSLQKAENAIVKFKGRAVWQKQVGSNWIAGISFLPSSKLLDTRLFLE